MNAIIQDQNEINVGYCFYFEGEVHVHQENHVEIGLGALNLWRYPGTTGCLLPGVLHEAALLL
jgi:hypothetical protein